jgi:hypothetical protein
MSHLKLIVMVVVLILVIGMKLQSIGNKTSYACLINMVKRTSNHVAAGIVLFARLVVHHPVDLHLAAAAAAAVAVAAAAAIVTERTKKIINIFWKKYSKIFKSRFKQ